VPHRAPFEIRVIRIRGFEQSFATLRFPVLPAHVVPRVERRVSATCRRRAPGERFSSNPSALPLTDFTGPVETSGLWGNASQWQWKLAAEPDGDPRCPTCRTHSRIDTTVIGSVR